MGVGCMNSVVDDSYSSAVGFTPENLPSAPIHVTSHRNKRCRGQIKPCDNN